MTISVMVDITEKFKRHISSLAKKSIYVGIPQDKTVRDDGPVKNATLGYINETGSPAQNIPARPFLLPGVKDAAEKITKILNSSSADLDADVEASLHTAGLVAQASVKRRIVKSVDMQGLSEVTKKIRATRKSRRRSGEMKPLIDTAQMLNSITYEIRDN